MKATEYLFGVSSNANGATDKSEELLSLNLYTTFSGFSILKNSLSCEHTRNPQKLPKISLIQSKADCFWSITIFNSYRLQDTVSPLEPL